MSHSINQNNGFDPFAHFVKNGKGAHVGRHLILDMWGITNHVCEDDIKSSFEKACASIGATVLFTHIHPFGEECGTTGVVILAESHLTWHHYPECNYIAIDVFVCGTLQPEGTVPIISDFWKPAEINVRELIRGQINDREEYIARSGGGG